jgi:aquaporin Z
MKYLNEDAPKVFLAEALFTGALCSVFLNVATSKKTAGNSYFGLAIGLVIVAGAYSVGTISGAAFNPSVALGSAVMNLISWYDLWVYFAAQIVGACIAAFIFRFIESKA